MDIRFHEYDRKGKNSSPNNDQSEYSTLIDYPIPLWVCHSCEGRNPAFIFACSEPLKGFLLMFNSEILSESKII